MLLTDGRRLGSVGELTVTVSIYLSRALCVHFPHEIPWPQSCLNALWQMSAGWHNGNFLGPRSRPTAGTYNRLPRRFTHRESGFLYAYNF